MCIRDRSIDFAARATHLNYQLAQNIIRGEYQNNKTSKPTMDGILDDHDGIETTKKDTLKLATVLKDVSSLLEND